MATKNDESQADHVILHAGPVRFIQPDERVRASNPALRKGRYTMNANSIDPEAIRTEERERVLALAKRYVSGSDYHQLRREAGAGVNVEQKDAIQEAAHPSAFMAKAKQIKAEEGCTMTEAIKAAHIRFPGLHRAMMQKGGDR